MPSNDTKSLYLIRHSKADFPFEQLKDLERALNHQGVLDSNFVAKKLLAGNAEWDIVISSHAFRAVNTAIIFAETLNFPVNKIALNSRLYESKVSDYLGVVNSISPDVRSAALFGHNETISEFYHYLTGSVIDFHTSMVVKLEIFGDWQTAGKGCAVMRSIFNA